MVISINACVAANFNIYTREAGAGGLSIAVEGPSKAEIDFQDKKDGSCEVAYTCTEPGQYNLPDFPALWALTHAQFLSPSLQGST